MLIRLQLFFALCYCSKRQRWDVLFTSNIILCIRYFVHLKGKHRKLFWFCLDSNSTSSVLHRPCSALILDLNSTFFWPRSGLNLLRSRVGIDRYISLTIFLPIFKHFTIIGYRIFFFFAHTLRAVDTVHSGNASARPPHVTFNKIHLRVFLYKQWGLDTSKTVILPLISEKYNVASQ